MFNVIIVVGSLVTYMNTQNPEIIHWCFTSRATSQVQPYVRIGKREMKYN